MDQYPDQQADTPSLSAALNRFNPSGVEALPMEQGPARTPDKESRYGFRIGNYGFLIQSATHCEVMDIPRIYPLPNAPGWLRGMANIRGNLVPIIALDELLNVSRNDYRDDGARRQRLLVTDKGDAAVGFSIDDVPRTLDLQQATRLRQLPPLPEAIKKHIPAGYSQGDAIWFEFEHREFFSLLAEPKST